MAKRRGEKKLDADLSLPDGGAIVSESAVEVVQTQAPAPRVVPENPVSSAQKARPKRRAQSDGSVPLDTFIRVAPDKDDQFAGFRAWCRDRGHERMTMDGWRDLYATFRSGPVGR